MKTSVSAAALALALSVGTAVAADLPKNKAPYIPPPPPPMWTGFYAGVNAGYAFNQSQDVSIAIGAITVDPLNNGALNSLVASSGGSGSFPVNSNGFAGGGQIGYNYQYLDRFVLGLETDIQGFVANSSSAQMNQFRALTATNTLTTSLMVSKKLDYLGTVRARVGYLLSPAMLVYVTGGLAYGGANSSTNIIQTFTTSPPAAGLGGVAQMFGANGAYSNTRAGWTVGGGLEWMFRPNWSAKAEYLYYDLGTVSHSGGTIIAPYNIGGGTNFVNSVINTTHFDGHIVRIGLNYHLNFAPPPVVAKY